MPMCADSQSSLFLGGEGDAWFARNIESINVSPDAPDLRLIYSTLGSFRHEINNILEIGCSSGAKVRALSEYFESDGYGIDPSREAIKVASAKLSAPDIKLDFQTGLATQLPYEDKKFDLVFFGFCLYLVPPNEIFKVVMEADRVLRNGVFLAILDFDYGQLRVNPYKHAPGILSYKNNYSQIFTSLGYFHQIIKWSFCHSYNTFALDKDERLSIEVLYKELI